MFVAAFLAAMAAVLLVQACVLGLAAATGLALHWSSLIVAAVLAVTAGASFAKGKADVEDPAITGIIDEGEEIIEEFEDSPALDAGLIGAAQAVEHYEIARYGTLKAWAEELGLQEAVSLLDATLNEEEETDGRLKQNGLSTERGPIICSKASRPSRSRPVKSSPPSPGLPARRRKPWRQREPKSGMSREKKCGRGVRKWALGSTTRLQGQDRRDSRF